MAEIRVLIADDDQALLKLIGRRLERMGLKYDMTEDGEDALDFIERRVYDLIVADIYMPGATGLEILRAAKVHDPHVQVIIMTAAATLENAIEALNNGAFNYLTKPFDHLSVLDNAVSKALEFRRLILDNLRMAEAQRRRGDLLEEEVTQRILTYSKNQREIHDLLSALPEGLLLVEPGGQVAVKNAAAERWLSDELHELERPIRHFLHQIWEKDSPSMTEVRIDDTLLRLEVFELSGKGREQKAVVIRPVAEPADQIKQLLAEPLAKLNLVSAWLEGQSSKWSQEEAAEIMRAQVSKMEEVVWKTPKRSTPRSHGTDRMAGDSREIDPEEEDPRVIRSWPPTMPSNE